jgi:mRNA interferase RelE/StbE
MSYAILFKETAKKELYLLPNNTLKKVLSAIDALALNPRPIGVKKLKGTGENLWRLRIGDYRVIYLIDDVVRIVNIRKIGNRRDVYDK